MRFSNLGRDSMMVLYAALFGYDELMRVIGKANKS